MPAAAPSTSPPLPQRNPAPASARVPEPVDMGLLADLPGLEVRARCLMDGFLAGRHRSPRQGSSVEFAEYRSYQFGDDPRHIDWRLYGRTERLHVKRYEEETQLRVFLVLDATASMDYRSSSSAPAPPRPIGGASSAACRASRSGATSPSPRRSAGSPRGSPAAPSS